MADTAYIEPRLRPQSTLSKVPYLPGLDGLRAVAVVAVMIYHASSEWLSGGFLGVEVFFVISGYLITLLLMEEVERTGRIDLAGFWIRRARRLLPALFLLLFLLLTYTWMFKPDTLGKLRGDMFGGLLYVMNWYQIWVGQGYSAAGDFAPLRHLWSLAVEEQFYLLWPLVMLVLLRRNGTRNLALTARWLVLGAVGVTVVVGLLYHPGRIQECSITPEAYWTVGDRCVSKADTLYLSTITRAAGLLLGAAFAMVWRPVAIMRGPLRDAGRLLDGVAVVGFAVLGFLCWKLHFITPSGADAWLFRGGFLWTSLATLMVIAAVAHRYSAIGRVLGVGPLVWVGTRSYGLYLYHWPIYQIIRKVAGNPLTFNQFIVAIALTVPITEASYRFVETPIRRRKVAAWWRGLGYRRDPTPRMIARMAVAVAVLLTSFGVLRLGLAELKQNEIAAALEENEAATVSVEDLLAGGGDSQDAPAPVPTAPPVSVAPNETTTTTSSTTTTLPSGPIDYLAIGDSVMKGAANTLTSRGYTVLAEESRQMIDMVPVMEQLGDAGVFDNVVVVHLGTNGSFDRETLDAFLAPLSDVPNVIMFNIRANRPWTASNNAILDARDSPADNIKLIDWAAKSQECPGNCFASDGIHLSADGAVFYASLIADFTGR